MTDELVMQLAGDAVKTTILIAGPMLAAAMIIGILVSILQAITQINEATLTFIPKMVAVILVLMVMAPWMLQTLENYTTEVLNAAGEWVR